jgi:hypothetical protein
VVAVAGRLPVMGKEGVREGTRTGGLSRFRRAIDRGNVSVVTMFGVAGVRLPNRGRASIGRFGGFHCPSLAGPSSRGIRDHKGRSVGGQSQGR